MEKDNLLYLAVALIEAAHTAGVRWRFAVRKEIKGVQHYLAPRNVFTRDLSRAICFSKQEDAVWLAAREHAAAVQVPVYWEGWSLEEKKAVPTRAELRRVHKVETGC
jgi:hypothetical protein